MRINLQKKPFWRIGYNWLIFLLEQAIQLLLKYTLALSVGYFSKTHKLTHLFEEVFTVYPRLERFYLENRDKIKIIEDSYLLSRYLGN